MNKSLIKSFTSDKFGDVRVVCIGADQEPYFIGKDVAECLGYVNTRDAINKHVDEEDRASVAIHDGSQNRNVVGINESGLYSLILSSKLETAKEFKRWVTSSVLPSIRKTGQYDVMKDMSPELQAIIMQDRKIQVIEEQVTHTGERLDNLENTMTINYGQAQELRELANLVVVNALGGKSSLAYKKLSKKAFSEFWHYYKQCFGVESYRNTPRVQFEHAKTIMYQWQPSDELKALIAWEQQAPVRNMTQPRPVQPIQVKGVVMRG